MIEQDRKQRLALTREADKAHEAMMQWYAKKLDVDRKNIGIALERLSESSAKQLLQQYKDQL